MAAATKKAPNRKVVPGSAKKAETTTRLKATKGEFVITANTGRITIIPPDYRHNKAGIRELVPGIVLDFKDGRYFTTDPKVVAAVESALAGEYGEALQENCLRDQLNVIKKAKPLPPIPAWDVRNDCFEVADAAGVLETEDAIDAAIKYEKSSAKRADVIEKLKAKAAGDPIPAPADAQNPTIEL